MKVRKRAMSPTGSILGRQRGALFRAGVEHYHRAMRDGYYIEAICIAESWIAERLECHLTHVTKINTGFKTLERLVKTYAELETDPHLKKLVAIDLGNWRKHRNAATHEMMKIEEGTTKTWEERVAANKAPAEEGMRLLRKIDGRTRQLLGRY